MRRTTRCVAAVCVAGAALAGAVLADGGSVRTADGIDNRFTLDFESDLLASRAVPTDSSIAGDSLSAVRSERPAVVFAVADADSEAGFDIVFQSTTGEPVGRSKNVGGLTPSTRGTSKCAFQLGVARFALVGDVAFSDDGGIVVAEVSAKAKDCKSDTTGVAVWTVVANERGGGAVNGIFLRDMETFDSVSTLRSDAGMPGNGAAIVIGRTAGGASVSYVIERREGAVR